jgi:hypothetical protein
MSAILGLMTTEQFVSDRFTNIRRRVFYFYPNGAAPLTGLLSLMKDEATNDPEYSWFEKRLTQQVSSTVAATGGNGGPFLSAAGTQLGATFTWTQDTNYRCAVADSTQFRTGHEVKFAQLTSSGTSVGDFIGVVTTNPAMTPGFITFRALSPTNTNAIDNGSTQNIGNETWVVGSTFSQGSYDITQEIYNLPQNVGNYCQIFRTPFSMTGTSIKTSAKYDETGPYKDKAKEHSVLHMIEMEKAYLFGVSRKFVGTDGLPHYTTAGVLSFLAAWEAGTIYGNTPATLNTDDNKRIISLTGGINEKIYEKYLERVFRVTNNMANEKLVLCGSGALSVLTQMYRSKTMLQARQGDLTTYGMTVVQHNTPYGTIYYKTHPWFSQNNTLRYNMLFLDVPNLRYRYVEGRDTELLRNRQQNDADFRKDEWLSECGLELRFPESHMYLQNVTDYVP